MLTVTTICLGERTIIFSSGASMPCSLPNKSDDVFKDETIFFEGDFEAGLFFLLD